METFLLKEVKTMELNKFLLNLKRNKNFLFFLIISFIFTFSTSLYSVDKSELLKILNSFKSSERPGKNTLSKISVHPDKIETLLNKLKPDKSQKTLNCPAPQINRPEDSEEIIKKINNTLKSNIIENIPKKTYKPQDILGNKLSLDVIKIKKSFSSLSKNKPTKKVKKEKLHPIMAKIKSLRARVRRTEDFTLNISASKLRAMNKAKIYIDKAEYFFEANNYKKARFYCVKANRELNKVRNEEIW